MKKIPAFPVPRYPFNVSDHECPEKAHDIVRRLAEILGPLIVGVRKQLCKGWGASRLK